MRDAWQAWRSFGGARQAKLPPPPTRRLWIFSGPSIYVGRLTCYGQSRGQKRRWPARYPQTPGRPVNKQGDQHAVLFKPLKGEGAEGSVRGNRRCGAVGGGERHLAEVIGVKSPGKAAHEELVVVADLHGEAEGGGHLRTAATCGQYHRNPVWLLAAPALPTRA